jgi:hypothetical protein
VLPMAIIMAKYGEDSPLRALSHLDMQTISASGSCIILLLRATTPSEIKQCDRKHCREKWN